MNPLYKAIITSIIYSDIFNFPLNREELWNFLISNNKISKKDFDKVLNRLSNSENTIGKVPKISDKRDSGFLQTLVITMDGYYCLRGREEIIAHRKKNKIEVMRKMEIAKKATYYLSHIKSILFIGISGGLAMGDVEKGDDIDFFVITKRNNLYKTRFLILLTLQLLNLRRKRKDSNPADKICVNFLIDEDSLYFTNNRHDVYTAHEILQIIPLYDSGNVIKEFLNINNWVKEFYPNSKDATKKITDKNNKNIILSFVFYILDVILSEKLCKMLQIFLISKHKKGETVTNHVLAFNPNDYRVQTLTKLRLISLELGLLTKR